jgi:hypothetical protein
MATLDYPVDTVEMDYRSKVALNHLYRSVVDEAGRTTTENVQTPTWDHIGEQILGTLVMYAGVYLLSLCIERFYAKNPACRRFATYIKNYMGYACACQPHASPRTSFPNHLLARRASPTSFCAGYLLVLHHLHSADSGKAVRWVLVLDRSESHAQPLEAVGVVLFAHDHVDDGFRLLRAPHPTVACRRVPPPSCRMGFSANRASASKFCRRREHKARESGELRCEGALHAGDEILSSERRSHEGVRRPLGTVLSRRVLPGVDHGRLQLRVLDTCAHLIRPPPPPEDGRDDGGRLADQLDAPCGWRPAGPWTVLDMLTFIPQLMTAAVPYSTFKESWISIEHLRVLFVYQVRVRHATRAHVVCSAA